MVTTNENAKEWKIQEGMLEWKHQNKLQIILTMQVEQINQWILARERWLKRYLECKKNKENWTFQNNKIKLHQQIRGECLLTKQQADEKNAKQFKIKILGETALIRKSEWINNLKEELQGAGDGPEIDRDEESLTATLKKYRIKKTPGHDGTHGFWF